MFYGKEGSSDLLVRVLHYSDRSRLLLPWQIRSSLTVLTVIQYMSSYNKTSEISSNCQEKQGLKKQKIHKKGGIK